MKTNIATLFGAEPGSKPTWVVPLTFVLVALAGVVWAIVLRGSRPQLYSNIGFGAIDAPDDPNESGGLDATVTEPLPT
jgi:hypothetical protein